MKTFWLRSQFLIVIVAFIGTLAAPALQLQAQNNGPVAVVTAATVNLRAGPGLNFSDVGSAKVNDRFPVVGRAHGSDRVWYKIVLPSGDNAWISERVVNVLPSADGVPWLEDNPQKVDMIMDCGIIPPILFVGANAQITKPGGLDVFDEPGVSKQNVGFVDIHEIVKVVDGPFCTRLDANFYTIQWLVQAGEGATSLQGYMDEGRPDGTGGYNAYTALVAGTSSSSDSSSKTANYSDRPSWVSDSDIVAVEGVFQGVQSGKYDEQAVQDHLTTIVDASSPAALAWIVRRVPIYDNKTGRWESFARYEDLTIMQWTLTSQLDTDPVTTTSNILFGNYSSTDEIWQNMGCGGG